MKPGYIYVISNPIYDHYGKNIYKIGETGDLQKRLNNYTTPYIDPCQLVYQSIKLPDSKLAENIVFERLSIYRIKQDREFFQCEINHIISVVEFMAQQLMKLNTDEINYLKEADNPSILIDKPIIIQPSKINVSNNVCPYCNRWFKHHQSNYRHRKICKEKELNELKNTINENLKKKGVSDSQKIVVNYFQINVNE